MTPTCRCKLPEPDPHREGTPVCLRCSHWIMEDGMARVEEAKGRPPTYTQRRQRAALRARQVKRNRRRAQ